jgi:hypothetical protein
MTCLRFVLASIAQTLSSFRIISGFLLRALFVQHYAAVTLRTLNLLRSRLRIASNSNPLEGLNIYAAGYPRAPGSILALSVSAEYYGRQLSMSQVHS